jgi:hypothetical protein
VTSNACFYIYLTEHLEDHEAVSGANEDKAGLADVLAKILTKKTSESNVILSKGKSDRLIDQARLKKKSVEEGAENELSNFQVKTEKQLKVRLDAKVLINGFRWQASEKWAQGALLHGLVKIWKTSPISIYCGNF